MPTPTTIAPDRLAAYGRAVFTIAGAPELTLRIGEAAEGMAELMDGQGAQSITIITASNPGGVKLSDARNATNYARMRDTLASLGAKYLPATGGAQGWGTEQGFAVFDMHMAVAVQLGARFDQDAIARAGRETGVLELVTLR